MGVGLNSKLQPMNTSYRSIPLQSGQSLAFDRRRAGRLFLAEGEVLMQPPAEWLAGTLVLAPARRISAPAELVGDLASLTALGAARLQVEEPAPPLQRLKAAWAGLRFPRRHGLNGC